MSTTLGDRRSYRSSQRVCWGHWLMGLVPLAGVALMMAVGLSLAADSGWQAVMFASFVAGLPVAGIMYLLVDWAHCRNRPVAVATAMLAGAMTFGGPFQLDLIKQHGPSVAHRLDLLPAAVVERARADVAADNDLTANGDEAVRKQLFLMMIGGLLIIGLPVMAAWTRAGWAYSEAGGTWMRRSKTSLPPGCAHELLKVLASGGHETLRELRGLELTELDSRCEVIMEDRSHATSTTDEPEGFLTLTEYDVGRTLGGRRRINSTCVVRQMELSPEEMASLSGLFTPQRSSEFAGT